MGYLDDQLTKVKNNITQKKAEIAKLEDAYESLRNFRTTVGGSRDDFDGATKKRKTALKDLDSIKSRSNAAKKYRDGMNVSLNNVGTKVVVAAYWGLDALIGAKLQGYRAAIELAEGDLLVLGARKKELETKIAIGDAIV